MYDWTGLILVCGTALLAIALGCAWWALRTAYSWWRERPVRKRLETAKGAYRLLVEQERLRRALASEATFRRRH